MGLVRYWNEHRSSSTSFMLPMAAWGDSEPNMAASYLCDELSGGFIVTAVSEYEITISRNDSESWDDTTYSGSVEDMALLRRVVLMWVCGFDMETLRTFLVEDILLPGRLMRALEDRQPVLA